MTNETSGPKLKIPLAQKQQLYQAIIALFTVALGIVLTLSAQYVSQEFGLPAGDPVLELGTSHFANLVADTYGVTTPIDAQNVGLPSVVTTDIVFGTATGAAATIPDGEIWLVHSVFVQTTTNFNCTGDNCTLTIGDDLDVDGFLAAADASIQATFTEATGYPAGFYGIEAASGGAYTLDDGGPFVYAPSGAAQTIDYVIAGTDPAAGAATIYVVYTRIQ